MDKWICRKYNGQLIDHCGGQAYLPMINGFYLLKTIRTSDSILYYQVYQMKEDNLPDYYKLAFRAAEIGKYFYTVAQERELKLIELGI